jgi:nicotinamidase-related amidase
MEDWKLVGKVALLVLDMQHDIVGFGGKEESSGFPGACQESGIIPRIQTLLKVFREKKLPVIYVVAEFNPLVKSPAYGFFNERMRIARPNAPNSTGTQIIPELAPDGTEPVVRKWNVGPFSNSNLHEVLKHYGAETLVMVGVATNFVVYIGTLQAIDLGYSVIVLKDAVTTNDKEAHEYYINKALPLFSLVTTSQDLLSKL